MPSQGISPTRDPESRIAQAAFLSERNLIEGGNLYTGDVPVSGFSGIGVNTLSPTGNFLAKSGDVRLGPMGDEHTFQPILNGIIDVSTNERYNFPWIFLTPEDGINDDDLETIIQGADVRPNQILYIQTGTANVTITIKNTGNIMTLNNEDVLLSFGLVAELRYSQLLGAWVMMNVNTGGGGSGEENRIFQGDSSVTVNDAAGGLGGVINFAVDGMPVGSFTTRLGLVLEKNLNMASNDILGVGDIGFNVTGQGFVSSTTGINYVVPLEDAHDFFVDNINKLKISVDVTITANTLLDGNLDMLADDSTIIHLHNLNFIQENQSIQSTATGLKYRTTFSTNHEFYNGASTVPAVSITSYGIDTGDIVFTGNTSRAVDNVQIGRDPTDDLFIHSLEDRQVKFLFGAGTVPNWTITDNQIEGNSLTSSIDVGFVESRTFILMYNSVNPTINGSMATVDGNIIMRTNDTLKNMSNVLTSPLTGTLDAGGQNITNIVGLSFQQSKSISSSSGFNFRVPARETYDFIVGGQTKLTIGNDITLGADLDFGGNDIVGTGDINIQGDIACADIACANFTLRGDVVVTKTGGGFSIPNTVAQSILVTYNGSFYRIPLVPL